MSAPILQVKNLTISLQLEKKVHRVVDGVSFNLHLGKTLAIVGESGSGKTLTALSILRILPSPPVLSPEGEMLYRGKNLISLSEKEMRRIRGARIAMIFQDPATALNPVFTIGEQLIEVAELHLNLYGEEAWERAEKALHEVGIPSPRNRLEDYPHQLSGGMKQRVMIAMALMCEPDILIADEPTTALDVTIQAQVLDLMRDLQKKKGMALLLITHDMGIVAEMADDVLVLYAGEVVEEAQVGRLFDHPAHPYTQGLFASRPSINTGKGKLTPIPGSVPSVGKYPHGCRFHPRCPFVMGKCREGKIPFFSVFEDQQARCVLYDGSEESRVRKADGGG